MTIHTLLSKLQKKPKQDDNTLSLAYTKVVGTACEAYYVDVIVRTEGGESAPVKIVVDTGAMISTIPESVIADKTLHPFLLGRPLIVRDHEGKVRRARTYKVDLLILKNSIPWAVSRPVRGVTARKNNVGLLSEKVPGLLGLDVLCDFVTHFDTTRAHMTWKGGKGWVISSSR